MIRYVTPLTGPWLAMLVALPHSVAAQTEPTIVWPSNLAVPFVVKHACPGEGCMLETGLACSGITVHADPGTAAAVSELAYGDRVAITDGEVHISAPGRVAMVRAAEKPVRVAQRDSSPGQHWSRDSVVRFAQTDTLYVLNYHGEGFFTVWHAGRFYQTEVFWPWESLHRRPDYQYDGRVLSERAAAFWVNVRTADSVTGWIEVDYDVFKMSGYYAPASELRCPPRR